MCCLLHDQVELIVVQAGDPFLTPGAVTRIQHGDGSLTASPNLLAERKNLVRPIKIRGEVECCTNPEIEAGIREQFPDWPHHISTVPTCPDPFGMNEVILEMLNDESRSS